ncbi:MAG: NUDIX hydrolase [Clostridia bacterium]|jgi:8-oxo-dGTP diphosphatase
MKLTTLCYIKDKGRTLMLHRVKREQDIHGGKWNGLGGKLEQGETPEECVIREVYEESGLIIQNPTLRGILTFPLFYDGEDEYTFVFTAEDFQGNLRESDEGILQWIDDAEISSLNLWEGDRIFLKWLETGRFFSGKLVYEKGRLVDYQVVFY